MTEMYAAVSGHGAAHAQAELAPAVPHVEEHKYDGMGMLEACQQGNLGVVMLLWYQGASLTKGDENGITPLHQCAYHGRWLICEFLLEHGAEVDPVNYNGNTPIMWAAVAGHAPVVSILATRGASLTRVDDRGYNVLFHAVHNEQTHMLNFFANEFPAQLDWHAVDKDGHNLFQWAVYKGFLGTARYLSEVQKVSVECVDSEGRSSLHWAAREGYYNVVEYILSKPLEKSLTHRDAEGLSAADAATSRFHVNVAALINREASRLAAGGARKDPFASRKASSLQLMIENPRYLRQFFYGVVFPPLYWMTVIWYVPVWFAIVGFPLTTTVFPVVLDGILFRAGQPPVREKRFQQDNQLPTFSKTLQALSLSGERNLAVMPVLAWANILLPYLFLTLSGVGARLQIVHPHGEMLCNGIYYAATLGLAAFCLASLKRPAAPALASHDSESGARRIPNSQGSFSYEAMQRLSLRSVYEPLSHRVVACFDHFSVPLDNAIGKGNVGFYVLWLACTLIWTVLMAYSTYYWGLYVLAPEDTKVSACRVLGRFIFNGMPAGDPYKQGWWTPTLNEIKHMWLGTAPAFAAMVAAERLISWSINAAAAQTWWETRNPKAVPVTVGLCAVAEKYPNMGGAPQSFIKSDGQSMYSLGSGMLNILAMIFGTHSGYNSKCEVPSVENYRVE